MTLPARFRFISGLCVALAIVVFLILKLPLWLNNLAILRQSAAFSDNSLFAAGLKPEAVKHVEVSQMASAGAIQAENCTAIAGESGLVPHSLATIAYIQQLICTNSNLGLAKQLATQELGHHLIAPILLGDIALLANAPAQETYTLYQTANCITRTEWCLSYLLQQASLLDATTQSDLIEMFLIEAKQYQPDDLSVNYMLWQNGSDRSLADALYKDTISFPSLASIDYKNAWLNENFKVLTQQLVTAQLWDEGLATRIANTQQLSDSADVALLLQPNQPGESNACVAAVSQANAICPVATTHLCDTPPCASNSLLDELAWRPLSMSQPPVWDDALHRLYRIGQQDAASCTLRADGIWRQDDPARETGWVGYQLWRYATNSPERIRLPKAGTYRLSFLYKTSQANKGVSVALSASADVLLPAASNNLSLRPTNAGWQLQVLHIPVTSTEATVNILFRQFDTGSFEIAQVQLQQISDDVLPFSSEAFACDS